MASKLYLGSIDPMKIQKEKIKEFTRKDGTKGYSIDVAIWVEDSPDEDWKAVSIQQSTTRDEASIYLGNCKLHTPIQQSPVATVATLATTDTAGVDDLPF